MDLMYIMSRKVATMTSRQGVVGTHWTDISHVALRGEEPRACVGGRLASDPGVELLPPVVIHRTANAPNESEQEQRLHMRREGLALLGKSMVCEVLFVPL